MNELDKIKQDIEALKAWKRSLESTATIPLEIDQSFRERFSLPIIEEREVDIPNADAQNTSSVTVDIPIVKVGDAVFVTPPSGSVAGFDVGSILAYVSDTGVVTVRFANADTGSSWNPASGLYTFVIFKKR